MNLDYEAIAAKVNREAAQMEVDTSFLEEMEESRKQSDKENRLIVVKQNRLSNAFQIVTMITAILTLLATVWFGTRG